MRNIFKIKNLLLVLIVFTIVFFSLKNFTRASWIGSTIPGKCVPQFEIDMADSNGIDVSTVATSGTIFYDGFSSQDQYPIDVLWGGSTLYVNGWVHTEGYNSSQFTYWVRGADGSLDDSPIYAIYRQLNGPITLSLPPGKYRLVFTTRCDESSCHLGNCEHKTETAFAYVYVQNPDFNLTGPEEIHVGDSVIMNINAGAVNKEGFSSQNFNYDYNNPFGADLGSSLATHITTPFPSTDSGVPTWSNPASWVAAALNNYYTKTAKTLWGSYSYITGDPLVAWYTPSFWLEENLNLLQQTSNTQSSQTKVYGAELFTIYSPAMYTPPTSNGFYIALKTNYFSYINDKKKETTTPYNFSSPFYSWTFPVKFYPPKINLSSPSGVNLYYNYNSNNGLYTYTMVIPSNSSTTISWSAEDFSSLSVNDNSLYNNNTPQRSGSGSFNVSVGTTPVTYTVSATGPGGSVGKTLTVIPESNYTVSCGAFLNSVYAGTGDRFTATVTGTVINTPLTFNWSANNCITSGSGNTQNCVVNNISSTTQPVTVTVNDPYGYSASATCPTVTIKTLPSNIQPAQAYITGGPIFYVTTSTTKSTTFNLTGALDGTMFKLIPEGINSHGVPKSIVMINGDGSLTWPASGTSRQMRGWVNNQDSDSNELKNFIMKFDKNFNSTDQNGSFNSFNIHLTCNDIGVWRLYADFGNSAIPNSTYAVFAVAPDPNVPNACGTK